MRTTRSAVHRGDVSRAASIVSRGACSSSAKSLGQGNPRIRVEREVWSLDAVDAWSPHRRGVQMRLRFVLISLVGWIAGCGDDDVTSVPDAAVADASAPGDASAPTLPRLVDAPCRYEIDASQRVGETVHCSDLFVASRRDGAPATEIRLHVVRFGPVTPRPDPIVFLTGGPGEDLSLTWLPVDISEALVAERDFVQITQRGIGEVVPRLDCPALAEVPRFRGDRGDEVDALEAAALRSCRDELVAAGVDLAAFSSRELAGDVEDLRVALGVRQVALVGGSYGSLWALEIMRRYPTSVRASVIDSIAAPSLPWTLQSPRGLQTALERLFAYCADSPACAERYGAGYPLLQRAFAALEEEPLVLPESEIALGANDLGQLVFSAMYDYQLFGSIPLLLELAAERDAEGLEAIGGPFFEAVSTYSESASVMGLSVWCSDSAQYYDVTAIDEAHAGVWPEISRTFRSGDERLVVACAQWPLAPAESLRPVVSDIPTLVGNGEMDPVTPDTSAEVVVSTLSRGRFVSVPRLGHGGVIAVCGFPKMLEFIANPDPEALDLSCIEDVPAIEFVLERP
jgi:pimeloyl-ACP methyl ester carboxylesterase